MLELIPPNTKRKIKIRVRLASFNYIPLIESCKKIFAIVKDMPINSISLVTLPTKKRIYCVLRSPHVDKDSREHFEVRVHKRVIDIYYDSEIDLFTILSKTELPSGVNYRIRIT